MSSLILVVVFGVQMDEPSLDVSSFDIDLLKVMCFFTSLGWSWLLFELLFSDGRGRWCFTDRVF